MLLLILSIYIYQTLTPPPLQSNFLFFLSAQTISLFLSDPVATHKVWNTKSLKEMPFFVKIHQHYPQGRNSLDNTQQGESCEARTCHAQSLWHSAHLFSFLKPLTHRNDDKAFQTSISVSLSHSFHTLSLTEVRTLDHPEVTVASEGARGYVRGEDLLYSRAFFLIPHHRHHPAAVHTVHGKIPEAFLLEGQG